MKKIICLLLVLTILVCATVFSVNAWPSPMRYGDADGDFEVSILDATYIGLYVAQYVTMDRGQKERADVDNDGEVSVIDATTIQLKVAGLIDEFPSGKLIYDYYFTIDSIYIDCENDWPVVGETITVTVDAECDWEPLIYSFYIDDILVYASKSDMMEYTFDKAGGYQLDVYVRNALDYEQHISEWISVKEGTTQQ